MNQDEKRIFIKAHELYLDAIDEAAEELYLKDPQFKKSVDTMTEKGVQRMIEGYEKQQ